MATRRRLSMEYEEEDMTEEAGTAFATVLEKTFPRAVPESVFIDHATEVLNKHGFTPETSINLVSTCRDELCRPFTEHLDAKWGDYFNIASLAGFVFCGRTGFKAAMAHAPVVDGKERYVFWVAPHIALDAEGSVGKCMRHGREHPSSACGALLAVQGEIKSGKVSLKLEQTDMEQSLVKQELISHLPYGKVPDLVELTYAAYECILREVESTLKASIDPSMCEFAIVAGIQVHGPAGQNFFWPGTFFKVTGTEHVRTDLYEDYAAAVNDWHVELKGWSSSEALTLLQKRQREARLAAKEGDMTALRRLPVDLITVRDNHKRSLLHVAAMYNQLEVAEHLLRTGGNAFVNLQDLDRKSAMDYAVEANFDEMAMLLKNAGGGLEGETLKEGLMRAVEQLNLEEFGRYVAFAKNKQEALAATDKDGRSLVHVCVRIKEQQEDRVKKQERILNDLLNLGLAKKSVDFFGREAPQSAAK